MFRLLVALSFALFLQACTVSLLPEYDPKIVEKIEDLNEQAQVLFASVERGSPASKFAAAEPTYNEILGGLSAVLLQVQVRPQPALSERVLNKVVGTERIRDFCLKHEEATAGEEQSCFFIVTPFSLTEARETLAEMRDVHQRRGLGPVLAANFINLFNISIEQALTVESALGGNTGG